MRHNTGFVSLQKPKKMKIRIKIHWSYKCILTVVYAGIIYWKSSSSTSSVPLPYHTDKLAHFVEFGLLCLLTCWALSTVRIGNRWIHKTILAIGLVSLYGISDEFHQLFTPNRTVDIFDWLADTAGAVTAAFLWRTFTHNSQNKGKITCTEQNCG